MFSGNYHGKQCHAPDLVHVLQRAWDAGVERIIVSGNQQFFNSLLYKSAGSSCLKILYFLWLSVDSQFLLGLPSV